MSRHQAYRNYDYENDLDEYDGGEDGYGEEEEGLSAEDKEQMEACTTEIRSILGPQSSKVTTTQIQEALWHYYYDVDKSVTYLITKFIDPPAPKAAKSAPVKNKGPAGIMAPRRPNHSPFANFFHDMPWLNTPQDRQASFTEPPRAPGGLLGGSGGPPKMSKLQLLAAERKRKAEEQKAKGKNSTGATAPVQETTQQLSKLSVSSQAKEGESSVPMKRKTNDLVQLDGPPAKIPPRSDQTPPKPETDSIPTEEVVPADPAAPSDFAQALLGSAPPAPAPRTYALPYMTFTSSSVLDAFSGPSPDDVVLTAQAKASNKKLANTTKKKGTDDKIDQTADGVKTIKLDDAPLPKSKNLNVLSEYEKKQSKKSASFVVVGHVDAGKSTLMGRLLLDLNVVDQRTIERYRKEAEQMGKSSFALAWVLDQRTEERSRGVTIDIATNRFETETTAFTVLDAPGHRDFIPNMIAGASQADFAILVVDASTGSFESGLKGQTREHSLLIRSMGVSRVIVAVNKLDTVGWSQERFDEITHQVSGFMSTTGFQLKNISFVPVSGLNGDNIIKKSPDPALDWYTGDTLIQELEKSEPLTRALDKPLRLTISEVFRTAQSPLTISGRIDAGSLQAGDALLVQPSGEKAYVKSLELDSEPVDWAVAGQNVVIHLANIDPIHVRVGDIVCDPKSPVNAIDTFTMKALAFDILMPSLVDVHRGRMWAPGRIVEMPAILDKVKGNVLKKKPRIVKPASVARLVVKMNNKVPLEAGQRVVLRSNGETIAAGLLE
ncbi:Hsp70 suppressor, GTPase facilitates ribosomal subunit dissociation [Pestalotiopsis sp. 9143b]|nr:Hsp70 suppressor, GTPase facilitates ribosomal subunit dissociation [Pestalotiopsis sp. 9143b]